MTCSPALGRTSRLSLLCSCLYDILWTRHFSMCSGDIVLLDFSGGVELRLSTAFFCFREEREKEKRGVSLMKKKLIAPVLSLALALSLVLAAPACAEGETAAPGLNNTVASLGRISAVIDENGGLWTWGSNYYGQVGNGGVSDSTDNYGTPFQSEPVKIMDRVSTVAISVYDRAGAVKEDGSLWVWGCNDMGLLGNGSVSVTHNGMPVQLSPVKIMDGVADVSMGSPMSAALKTDGSLWMWGMNRFGVLGSPSRGNKTDPYNGNLIQDVPAKVMDGVTAVSCGTWHTAAIKTDGSLWVWGSNRDGQLGIGQGGNKTDEDGIPYQDVPVKVMDNVAAVSCGPVHTAAVKTDGSLWVWGTNKGGLGTGDFENRYTPTKIMDGVKAVACGDRSTFILRTDNTLWATGPSSDGELGMNDKGNVYVDMVGYFQTVPAQIMEDVAAVTTSGSVTFVVKNDGTLWTFGINGPYRSLGLDKDVNWAYVPTQVTRFKPMVPSVGGFVDVKKKDYYADAVVWAVDKGITTGTSATTFSPNVTCTVAQIMTFLWRANGAPQPSCANPFTDVPENAYYAKAALWAYEKGLVSGSTFGGDAPCTRSMTVGYLWALAGKPAAGNVSFTDVPAGASYVQAVAWAVENGITTGTSSTTFAPDLTCTRGQIMTFLYRDSAR